MKYLDDDVQGIRIHHAPVTPGNKLPVTKTGDKAFGKEIALPLVAVWPGCVKARRIYAAVYEGQPIQRYVIGPDKKGELYLRHENYPGLLSEAQLAEADKNKSPFCNPAMHLKQFMAGMSDAMVGRTRGMSNELGSASTKLQAAYDAGFCDIMQDPTRLALKGAERHRTIGQRRS